MDIMNSVSFPLPELGSDWAKVIEAVQRFGSAELRTQAGETFEFKKKAADKPTLAELRARHEAHCQKLRELGNRPAPMTEQEEERFNKIIAGEL